MKPTAVGLHVKTRDRVKVLDAVRAAMGAVGLKWVGGGLDAPDEAVRLVLLPSRGGWTSLYPEEPELARGLAERVALELDAPVLVVGHYEESAFFYLAFGPAGEELDAYHSCPDYSKGMGEDDASEAELEATRGDAAVLAGLVGGEAKELERILAGARIERLRDHDVLSGAVGVSAALERFAEQLGLPDLLQAFEDVWAEEDEDDDESVRHLAYARPRDPGQLARLFGRLRDRWGGAGAAQSEGAEEGAADDEAPDELDADADSGEEPPAAPRGGRSRR